MSDCNHPILLPVTATCAECEMSAHQIIHQAQERIAALEGASRNLVLAIEMWQYSTVPATPLPLIATEANALANLLEQGE